MIFFSGHLIYTHRHHRCYELKSDDRYGYKELLLINKLTDILSIGGMECVPVIIVFFCILVVLTTSIIMQNWTYTLAPPPDYPSCRTLLHLRHALSQVADIGCTPVPLQPSVKTNQPTMALLLRTQSRGRLLPSPPL